MMILIMFTFRVSGENSRDYAGSQHEKGEAKKDNAYYDEDETSFRHPYSNCIKIVRKVSRRDYSTQFY